MQVKFDIDANGIVHVSAKDKATSECLRVVFPSGFCMCVYVPSPASSFPLVAVSVYRSKLYTQHTRDADAMLHPTTCLNLPLQLCVPYLATPQLSSLLL